MDNIKKFLNVKYNVTFDATRWQLGLVGILFLAIVVGVVNG